MQKKSDSYYAKKELRTKEEFKEFVKGFFIHCDSQVPKEPYLIPSLAEYLGWNVEEVIGYPRERKYGPILDKAKLKCEVYLNKAMFLGKIDKTIGSYMLKAYFRYQDRNPDGAPLAGVKKSIRQVLDEIEDIEESAK